MDNDRAKRAADEVLFKWDDGADAKRRSSLESFVPPSTGTGYQPVSFGSRQANMFHNVNTSQVLPREYDAISNVRLEAKQLRETVANIHLTHNRDWLAANTRVAALAKVDVLDKISCLYLNRESAMRYESLRYMQRECTSEFEFNRMIYENRLQRLNTPLMPELCVQPVYIRNSTLISRIMNKCSCPLHVYIEWDLLQQALSSVDMRNARSSLGGKDGKMMTASRPSLYFGGDDGFKTAREGSVNPPQGTPYPPAGAAVTGRPPAVNSGFDASQNASSNNPSNNVNPTFGNVDNNIGSSSLGGCTNRQGMSLPEIPGNWNLTAQDCRPSSQVTGLLGPQPTMNLPPSVNRNTFEHLEAICPMHVATALPELFCSTGQKVGVITDLDLMYKYEKASINNKAVHVLSLHKLSGDPKVYNYRLPSAFHAMNSVYLRDFELDRYNAAVNIDQGSNETVDDLRKTYLSSVYSGPALLIATESEFLIAVMHKKSKSMTLGVIAREKNQGHVIKQVVCHRASGRVFILAANSLLYEYQYQLGSVDLRDRSILGMLMGAIAKGCTFIVNTLTNDRVFRLKGTVHSGYSVDLDVVDTDDHDRADLMAWWNGSGNCMTDISAKCPLVPTLYWPPLQWRELHQSLQESSFSDHNNKDTCDCSRHQACVKQQSRTCLKLLNPWCKSFLKVFSCGESTMCVDQDRWLVTLLCEDTGDLSVFKIHDECAFNSFVKGVVDFDRIYPYSITFFSLRNSQIMQQLHKGGYFRLVGSSSDFRGREVLSAPLNMNNGVQLILVDRLGSRIYVGFVSGNNKKISLAVKGFKVQQTLLECRAQEQQNQSNRFSDLMRDPMRKLDLKPIPIKRSYFQANDLFVACELYVKTLNMILCKVTVCGKETASMCQTSSLVPRSVSEELWSHNQRMSSARDVTDLNAQRGRCSRPIEWFDEFCILLSPGEDVMEVYAETGKRNPGRAMWEESDDSKLIIITSHKVYTLNCGSPFKLLKALLKNPISTIKYLDPPLIAHNQRASLLALKNSKLSGTSEHHQFVDIFQDDKRGEMCGEGEKREAIANGLYYLCWLYTPEEVFKACWRFLLDSSDPILEDVLLNGGEGNSLMLTSLGISSQLFGWTAPGAYALDDAGKPTTPVISPWCKFVIFNENMTYRFNRISTNLTSPAIDGILALLSSMLEPAWFDRAFVCVPLFTSVTCPGIKNASSVPFCPQNQINRRNEFVIGPKFESDLILSLSRPIEEVKATLSQLRKLYLLLLRVAQNYEALSPKVVERMAEGISRLALNLQRDIFVEDSHPEDLVSASSNGAFDAKVVLQRLGQRRDQDFKTIKEMATVLEIAQEYLACCILLHHNCIYGDVTHEFAKMISCVELLPSKSPGMFTCGDLSYYRTMQMNEPVVFPFYVKNDSQMGDKPKYAFTMSRDFFHLISKSNMLNLCSNQEFFRAFRVAVWLAGGEVSNLQDHFYGHLFKPDELRIKHWSSMVKSLEKQLASADNDASISHYARMLMKFIGDNNNLHHHHHHNNNSS